MLDRETPVTAKVKTGFCWKTFCCILLPLPQQEQTGRTPAFETVQVAGTSGTLRLPIALTHTKIVCTMTTWLRRRAR